MSAEKSGWIGVDLDGTLAHYDRWRGPFHVGEPIPAMLERVKGWLEEGWEVRIFTARMSDHQQIAGIHAAIKEWCVAHGLPPLRATCIKDYSMVELWDDRAVAVEKNTGRRLSEPNGERTLA